MKIIKLIASMALWVWQLPQNLIGLALVAVWRPAKREKIDGLTTVYTVRAIVKDDRSQGISLGDFIFVEGSCGARTARHEFGHSRQSRVLGPFYLLAIGLPSLLWAHAFPRLKGKVGYYSFYTESWANQLGGLL